jgi:hypothetical protein
MARTVQECYDYITTNLVTEFAAVGVTINPSTWSKRNVLRNICYTIAISQALLEQLNDLSLQKMQDVQKVSAAASSYWLQDKMFKFQYSTSNPQVLQVANGVVGYAVEDATLRIIKACSVSSTVAQTVVLKVAKGSPLGALSSLEITAAETYVDQLGTAGIIYNVISLAADKLYLEADIYYDSAYNAVISAAVIKALQDYLETLSTTNFDGYIYVREVEKLIKNVPGVNDVVIQQMSGRLDSQGFGAGIDLVLGADTLNRRYQAGAGYLVEETTSGQTFTDSLNFIAE